MLVFNINAKTKLPEIQIWNYSIFVFNFFLFLVLDGDNDEKIANSLEDFFASKVSNIYNDILSKQSSTSVPHSICSTTKHAFRKFEYKDLKQIVLAIPSRSCEMDPIPIWLFKECFMSYQQFLYLLWMNYRKLASFLTSSNLPWLHIFWESLNLMLIFSVIIVRSVTWPSFAKSLKVCSLKAISEIFKLYGEGLLQNLLISSTTW